MDTLNIFNAALSIKEFLAILFSIGSVFTLWYTFVKKRIIREVESEISKSFESVVSKLSSNEPSERISAAILLRRFLD